MTTITHLRVTLLFTLSLLGLSHLSSTLPMVLVEQHQLQIPFVQTRLKPTAPHHHPYRSRPLTYKISYQSNNQPLTPVTAQNGESKRTIRKKVMGAVFGVLVGTTASVVLIILILVLSNVVLPKSLGELGQDISHRSAPVIYRTSIKAEDLRILDDDDAVAALTCIGRGGCGEVYKTDIPNEKIKTIAIKKIIMNTMRHKAVLDQMEREIQTVGRIRHRNVLPLLAHVSRPSCEYLVFEYMENGSLQSILKQVENGTRELGWLERYKIAVGVASGLEYLHNGHGQRIVHRDLKPDNVLLDADMEARITDFGLAKYIQEPNTDASCSNVSGTRGYIAPEYYQTRIFNDKCDIYSFGVLLGNLVTGKGATDHVFENSTKVNFVEWIREVVASNHSKEAIDPSLRGSEYVEQMLLVLKIACFCTLHDPKSRPDSRICTLMLAQITH